MFCLAAVQGVGFHGLDKVSVGKQLSLQHTIRTPDRVLPRVFAARRRPTYDAMGRGHARVLETPPGGEVSLPDPEVLISPRT